MIEAENEVAKRTNKLWSQPQPKLRPFAQEQQGYDTSLCPDAATHHDSVLRAQGLGVNDARQTGVVDAMTQARAYAEASNTYLLMFTMMRATLRHENNRTRIIEFKRARQMPLYQLSQLVDDDGRWNSHRQENTLFSSREDKIANSCSEILCQV